jgi:serine-type D-Ala-D-Ala carboxypeptidase/endopeptidase (penicillin-binding protein 4)
MRYASRFLLIALVAIVPGIFPPAQSALPKESGPVRQLRARLEGLFSAPQLSRTQIGVKVFSLDRSETIYEKDPQRLLTPASCNKLITVAAALLRLGATYRFQTRVETDGHVDDQTLKGNLVIIGRGDPSGSSQFSGEPFAEFRALATWLKGKNIRRIAGDIVGDDEAFGEPRLGHGWEWNDLSQSYAAPISALQFNDNVLTMEITPGAEEGNPALIRASPLDRHFKIYNQIVTGPEDGSAEIRIERGDTDTGILAFGAVPAKGKAIVRYVAVRNPTLYYLSALKQALSEEGIDTDACNIRTKTKEDLPLSLLWAQTSRELSEIVRPVLKESLNLPSETLVRVLGLELRQEGTFGKGKEVIEETLNQMGIEKGSYTFADGSGLSRLNLESADAFVRLLQFMHRDSSFQIFFDALPIAGVDGTLSARMKGTKAENNVHAKTGSMTNVSSISGYVKTADGEMLAFAIEVNSFIGPKDPVEKLQDRVLELLANFSRK